MIKLNDDLLQELGLGALPPEEKKKLLAHIYETLEMRVGMKLAEQMTDAQLDEFEQFITRNDEAGALAWLEANFPNYKDVVAAEFEKLKSEIRQVAPQILASSAAAAQMAPSAVPPQQPFIPSQQTTTQQAWGNSPQPQPLYPAQGQQPTPYQQGTNGGQQYPPIPPQPSDNSQRNYV